MRRSEDGLVWGIYFCEAEYHLHAKSEFFFGSKVYA